MLHFQSLSTTWSRNSVLILLTPSCSPDLLSLRRASISSINMIEGWRCLNKLVQLKITFGGGYSAWSLLSTEQMDFGQNRHEHYLATAKSALTSFSPSPSHLLVRLLELMLIRLLLASAARARASSVFPLPKNLLSPRVESNSIWWKVQGHNLEYCKLRWHPSPGGPKRRSPLAGALRPVKRSGLTLKDKTNHIFQQFSEPK